MRTLRSETIFGNWNPFKNDEIWFLFNLDFKIYDVTTLETNNCNTHIAQYLMNYRHQAMKFSQLIQYNLRNFFLKNSYTKCGVETIP